MNEDSSDATIINFVRNVWRAYFSEHWIAPKTLCYDPLSSITGSSYDLCHVAHDGRYMGSIDYDPDDQIYSIDPYDMATYPAGPNDLTTSDIAKLPTLECILFVSCDNLRNAQQVLEKLAPKGVVIVINECINLPKEYIDLNIEKEPMYGATRSIEGPNKYPREKVKNINAFIKS